MKEVYFGEPEFDMFFQLIIPFDFQFPEAHEAIDKLLYHLCKTHDRIVFGDFAGFDDFQCRIRQARADRLPKTFDSLDLISMFIGLCAVMRRVPLQYPDLLETSDRVIYEIAGQLDPAILDGQTFEEFHQKSLKVIARGNC